MLEETPEFLRDNPDDDELWFEQGQPKDFDFDRRQRSGLLDVAAGAGGLDDALDPDQVGGLAQVEALLLGPAETSR